MKFEIRNYSWWPYWLNIYSNDLQKKLKTEYSNINDWRKQSKTDMRCNKHCDTFRFSNEEDRLSFIMKFA